MSLTRAWTVAPYSGTMPRDRITERCFVMSWANLSGGYAIIYWSSNGYPTGGHSLFSPTFAPWVQVLSSDPTAGGAWTINCCYGQMLKQEMVNAGTTYMWSTEWDFTNSRWRTLIWHGGEASQNNTTQASANKRLIAYAMGRGYNAG